MAAIDEAKLAVTLPEPVIQALKDTMWAWIAAHANDRVFTAKVWIISKTFRVQDLYPVFELILGPRPA